MNHVIEPTPDGAVGKEYPIELNLDIPPATSAARQSRAGPVNGWDVIGRKAGELARTGGHYEDVYVKTAGRLAFQETRLHSVKERRRSRAAAAAACARNRRAVRYAAPLPPAANFIPPTQQSVLTPLDYLEIAAARVELRTRARFRLRQRRERRSVREAYTADACVCRSRRPRSARHARRRFSRAVRIRPPLPDEPRHRAHAGRRERQRIPARDRQRRERKAELALPRRTLRGHLREDGRPAGALRRAGCSRRARGLSRPPPAGSARLRVRPAPTGKNFTTSLSPTDYIDIQQLIARSAYALDTAADHGDHYAHLFTPDGVFAAQTGHPYAIRGREQLAAFAAGDLTHRGPAYVRDYETNYIISPSRDGATGRVYVVWIEVEENGTPGVVRSGGHYEDAYLKTRDGWKIKSRTFVPSKLGMRDVYDPDRAH